MKAAQSDKWQRTTVRPGIVSILVYLFVRFARRSASVIMLAPNGGICLDLTWLAYGFSRGCGLLGVNNTHHMLRIRNCRPCSFSHSGSWHILCVVAQHSDWHVSPIPDEHIQRTHIRCGAAATVAVVFVFVKVVLLLLFIQATAQ